MPSKFNMSKIPLKSNLKINQLFLLPSLPPPTFCNLSPPSSLTQADSQPVGLIHPLCSLFHYNVSSGAPYPWPPHQCRVPSPLRDLTEFPCSHPSLLIHPAECYQSHHFWNIVLFSHALKLPVTSTMYRIWPHFPNEHTI